MSKELLHILNKFSAKHNEKIKKIFSPILINLEISFFFYFFVEGNGNFGFLTNNLSYNEFFFGSDLYLTTPYFAHPSCFRSGQAFVPCAFGENYEKSINSSYGMDHLFLILESTEKKIEGFSYYNKNSNVQQLPFYIENLDVLTKFNAYFKREAKDLIQELQNNFFDMHKMRDNSFLEVDRSLPLSNDNIKIKKVLKEIYGLSPQEQRCLELFKKGHSAQATAVIMGLSRRTIETYFNIIKEKLNCNSKWDLLNL
mgnify:CR=1 FL=1